MLIKLLQLRKIIREELARTLREDVSSPSPMVQKLAGSGLGSISVTPISLRSLMTKAEKTGDMSLFDEWDKIVAAAREAKQALSAKTSVTKGITRSERTEAIEAALANQGLDPAGGDDEYGYAGYVGTLIDNMRSFGEPPTRDDIIAALELRKQKRDANELKKKQNQEALIAAKEEIPGYAKYIDFLYGEIMSAQHSEFQSYEQDVPKANIEKINSMVKAAWDPSTKSFDPAGMSDIDKMIPARFKK